MKRLFAIFSIVLISICTFAQPPRPQQHLGEGGGKEKRMFSPEEFKRHMEYFIAFRAGLTPEESLKFFPMLHEMMKAQRELGKKQRSKMSKPHEFTDAEAKKIVLETIQMEKEQRAIEETYYTKRFPKVLNWKKILKVRHAVEAYKQEALKHFSPNRFGHGPIPGQMENGNNNK